MKYVLPVLLAGLLFFALRLLLPPRVVYTPPEIITRVDTVEVLDTAWVDRIHTDTVNLVREVLIERWDTVLITRTDTLWALDPIIGMRAVYVPPGWGDTMRVAGFELRAYDDTLRLRRWQSNYFVAGPLEGIVADTIPPAVTFYSMPPPDCGFTCRAKLLGLGTLIGATGSLLLVVALGG